jgi:starch-binding outer membrane protein, SusD/RagB family
MKKISRCIIFASLFLTSCKQEFVNQNETLEADVYSEPRGIASASVSIQRVYALGLTGSRYNTIIGNGCVTNEYVLRNAGNLNEANLIAGGSNVDNLNGIVNSLWIANNKIIYEADKVIAAANALGDKKYASGLIAHASIFKALAIGELAQFWESIPSAPGTIATPANFQTRAQAYVRAVKVTDDALNAITANAPSAAVISALPVGLDFVNTLNALKARYSLFAGDYASAIATSNLVSSTIKSELRFDGAAAAVNPINSIVTATNNVVQAIDSTLGLPATLPPALTDARIPFYTSINATVAPRYRINGFYNNNTASIPIYIPDEMKLIRAEAYLRQSSPNTAAAKTELDAILTQLPSGDPFGVGANLPPLAAGLTVPQLLDEVYKNRCIELYMSGMRLEDQRRFNRPTTERRRSNFPYPFRERDNNPNTPPDPIF